MSLTKVYYSQIVKDRVKRLQKERGVTNADDMMKELDLGVNAIRQMTDNKGIGCFALARIADYLETTTDYLLGRSDIPDMYVNVSNSPSVSGNNNLVAITAENELEKVVPQSLNQLKKIQDRYWSKRVSHLLLNWTVRNIFILPNPII